MGVIRRYLTGKKYGFIAPDTGGDEIFFHLSVFDPCGDGPPPIREEIVTYSIGDGTRSDQVTRTAPPSRRSGAVQSYDPVTGYGFIATPEGQCYLHKSEVVGGMVPTIGSRVEFYTTTNTGLSKSPRACYVSVLT